MADRLALSADARKLLRRQFAGRPLSMRRHRAESLPGRSVEQTRQAYRELVATGLMEPVSTFAGGAEALYRLTERAMRDCKLHCPALAVAALRDARVRHSTTQAATDWS
jgi:hypothetical protein